MNKAMPEREKGDENIVRRETTRIDRKRKT